MEEARVQAVPEELQLLGKTFHSTRNVFMSMRGYAELIARHVEAPDKQSEWAARIVSQLDRLTDMFNTVERAWSRPQAPLQAVPMPLVLRSAERLARQRDLSISAGIDTGWHVEGVASVHGNANDLMHAVAALVQNALEASPRDGRIRIELTTSATRGWIARIGDAGPGICPSILSRVCEPFFSRKPGHAGLGLYLSRVMLERHGCSLQLECPPSGGTWAVISSREDVLGGNR
jgi:signal transduction histidine kinase